MHQRYLYAFVGIGIVVLGGVFWVWGKKMQSVPPQSQKPAEEVSEASKTENLDTSNWKTYRNEKYEYSFRYPSNWYVETKNSNSELSARGTGEKMGGDTSISNYQNPSSYNLGNIPADLFAVNLVIYNIDPAIKYNQFFADKNYEFDNMQEISLSNTNAIRLTGITTDHPSGYHVTNTFVKSKNRMFVLNYGWKLSNMSAIADEIVNSFVTSTWKTYTNDELGFELSFPAEWSTPEPFRQIGEHQSMFIYPGGFSEGCCAGVHLQIREESTTDAYKNIIAGYSPENLLSNRKKTVAGVAGREFVFLTHYGDKNEKVTAIPLRNHVLALRRGDGDKTAEDVINTFHVLPEKE